MEENKNPTNNAPEKKRGRWFPRRPTAAGEDTPNNQETPVANPQSAEQPAEKPKKSRSRSKNNAEKSNSKKENTPPAAEPKKRGRKPKASSIPYRLPEDSTKPNYEAILARPDESAVPEEPKPVVRQKTISENEATMTRAASLAIARENEKKREEAIRLKEEKIYQISKIRQAAQNNSVIDEYIYSVEAKDNVVFAVTYYQGVKVYIPFAEMFLDYDIKIDEGESSEKTVLRRRQILNKCIGAHIRFRIQDMFPNADETEWIILGSRKEAMLRDQAKYYIAPEGQEPYIQVGGTYDCEIISAGQHGVRAYLCGVDTQIWVYNLTWRPVDVVAEMFKPGDKLRVKVSEINESKTGEGFAVVVSAKVPELEEYRKNVGKISIRQTCHARITNLTLKDDIPVAHLFIGHPFNIPALSRNIRTDGMTRPLTVGDVVEVTVTGFTNSGLLAQVVVTKLVQASESYLAHMNRY